MHTAAAIGYPASHFPYATPRQLATKKSPRRLAGAALSGPLLQISLNRAGSA
jgi:hypothetical protein